MATAVDVDVWSDVVCPWCYIGKRRFERAVATLAGEVQVNTRYRPFQLDPSAPPGGAMPVVEAYARKFGGLERAQQLIDHVTSVADAEGLAFRLDIALRANTRLAHLLLVGAKGGEQQAVLKERLLAAYFHDGLNIGDDAVLRQCATEAGLEDGEINHSLGSATIARTLDDALIEARTAGITAVPTYVLNGRWIVPGAQDPATFAAALRKVAARSEAGR